VFWRRISISSMQAPWPLEGHPMTTAWIWAGGLAAVLGLMGVMATAALLYAALCLLVAHRMTTPRRVAALADPAWQGLAALCRVAFTPRHGSLPLAASFIAAPSAHAAVLFVHGKDGSRGAEVRVSTEPLVRALHAAGVAVLMLDLRGHGDSAASRMTYGIDEADDVLGAIDWLRAQGFTDGRIGVFAASMGGAGVLRAALRDKAIGPIVLDSTYADFAAMIDGQFTTLTGLPRCFLPGALLASRWLTGADLRRIRPVDDAQRLRHRPVLVIHAQGDPFVPVAHARRLAAAARGELWVTAGEHHLASFRDTPLRYVQRVAGFFERHLGRPVARPAAALAKAA
jgi:uncharacterized protein